MAKTIKDLKVGDVVWYTDVNQRDRATGKLRIREVTVAKIGSKLIHVAENSWKTVPYRIDTMHINDDYGHCTLIIDLEAYTEQQHKNKLLDAIRSGRFGDSLSYEDVKAAAILLGIVAS